MASRTIPPVARVDLGDRGLRLPHHTFAVVHRERALYPLFAAPLRPNETLIGLRFQARSMFQRMVKIAWATNIEVEVAIWKVPLSTIGDYFVDLVVADAEDSPFGTLSGSGVTSANSADVSAQGPNSQSAHHQRHRPWAGEVGHSELLGANAGGLEMSYTPYVSASVWHVARAYYELELAGGSSTIQGVESGSFGTTAARTDDDLWETPPPLSGHIRGALYSSVALEAGPDFDLDGAASSLFPDSIAQWAEKLSLMTRPNQTYAEYLAQFGVPASRVASLPEPIMVQRRMLRQMGSPQGWMIEPGGTTYNNDATITFRHGMGQQNITVGRVPEQGNAMSDTFAAIHETSGMTMLGTSWDVTRGKRIIIDEPSVLLGTLCWWPHQTTTAGEFGHVFDMTRMTHGSHWGPPTGGIDEADFLAAQAIYDPNGNPTQLNEDNITGPFAFNLLNLYLNGDSFTNRVGMFDFYNPLQGNGPYDPESEIGDQDDELIATHREVNTLGGVKLAIASDLMS